MALNVADEDSGVGTEITFGDGQHVQALSIDTPTDTMLAKGLEVGAEIEAIDSSTQVSLDSGVKYVLKAGDLVHIKAQAFLILSHGFLPFGTSDTSRT